MDKLYGMEVSWISKEHGLLRPDLVRTNAGVLPAIIRNLKGEEKLKQMIADRAVNPDLEERIRRSFPDGYDNVVFLICDGVGVGRLEALGGLLWDNVDPSRDSQGTVAHCTFPTLTSTNMASIAYGSLPSEHGLVGYNIYNENIGEVFNALNGKYVSDGEVLSIHERPNSDFVEGTPITDIIYGEHFMPIRFFVPSQQEREGLITLIAERTEITPYETAEQLLGGLISSLSDGKEQQFIAAYIGWADYFGHEEGPESRQYAEAIRGIEQVIATVIDHPKVKNGSTLVIMTSDHGQSQVDHSISRWLTSEEVRAFAEEGVLLSTSGRVLHCYTEDLSRGREVLEELADGRGVVLSQEEALGLIGDGGSWGRRMGDLVLLMDDHYLIDVPEVVKLEGHKERLLGQHGSTCVEEMFVPIGIWGGSK